MAILRSIVSFLFASCLFLVLPGFASAQGVYESQSSGDDHVIIGTHERGANMEKIVALAQRLTGNAELTSEDVLANLSHARRYVCRANGRQIYFGTDPSYGGRCPEGAARFDGVFGNWHYRVPRVHGDVLSPVTRRVTRPATFAPPDPRIAAYESTVEQLEDTMSDRDRLQTELASARADLSQANAALANWPEVRPVPVPVPAPVAAPAPVAQTESPLRIVFVVLVVLGLLVLMLWLIHFIRTPLLVKIEKLKNENTTLQGKLMEAKSFLRTSEEDCEREEAKSRWLAKRRYGLGKLVVYYRQLCVKTGRSLAVAQEMLEELGQFHYRKAKIAETHAKLAELRRLEDEYDVHAMQIEEARAIRVVAVETNDEQQMRNCDRVIVECECQIGKLPFDALDVKTRIAGLVSRLKDDMHAQCGLQFDGRSADEWKAEYEDSVRAKRFKYEAGASTYQALVAMVERQGIDGLAELARRKRELEEEQAKFLLQYEARIADLEKQLWDAGLDPGPDAPDMGVSAKPPRVPTQGIETLRESQLPMPPSTPTNSLNRDIYKMLDAWQILPQDSWMIICDEHAARDWAFFLYNCWISVPRIGPVRLRHLLREAKTISPAWLTERARLPTDPPPA